MTAGEYRTLLANHRDIPTLAGDIIVSTAVAEAEEADDSAPGEGKPAPSKSKLPPPDVTLHSLETSDRTIKPLMDHDLAPATTTTT